MKPPLAVSLVCCVVTSPCEATQHHPGILTLEGEETLVTQRKANLFPQGSKIDTSKLRTRNQNALSQVCVTTSDSAQHAAEESVLSNRELSCVCLCHTRLSWNGDSAVALFLGSHFV